MAKTVDRLHATVRGRVQGVSFRFYTRDVAASLGLTGWVANRYDGSVEIVAEGPRAKLERLLDFLQHGPPMSRVDDVQSEFSSAAHEFDHFTIEM